jgi:hypothetical protein
MVVVALDDDGPGKRFFSLTGVVTAAKATETSADSGTAGGAPKNAVSMVWYGDGLTIVFR